MNNNFDYDVALSFAGEQRTYVREVANILDNNFNLKVFFDEFEESKLWGKNLYDYLYNIYSKKAKYVILFVSKEYNEKMWTNHERQASQERAFREKNEYILPINFDDTSIPGLPNTTGYLDANKYSPYDIAMRFAEKFGILEKNRWFGKWKREQYSKAVWGTLNIYDINEYGFYFDLTVMHGSHIGNFEKEFAKYIDKNKAIFTCESFGDEELCKIEFIKLNDNMIIQESNCNSHHGMRAYFDGKYYLEKDFFNILDINDDVLSKIYSTIGKHFDDYLMCFSDYWIKEKDNKKIIFGKVPGMYSYYNAILIINDSQVRGAFVNVNINENDTDNIIYWFATDNLLDEIILDFKENDKTEQFKKYLLKHLVSNKDDES